MNSGSQWDAVFEVVLVALLEQGCFLAEGSYAVKDLEVAMDLEGSGQVPDGEG